jgi:DNA repair exonuclease SbcCD ATPase subunit
MQDITPLGEMTRSQLRAWNTENSRLALARAERARKTAEAKYNASYMNLLRMVAKVNHELETCPHTETQTERAIAVEDERGVAVESDDVERCVVCHRSVYRETAS